MYAIIKCHDAYIQNIHSLEKRPLFEVDNITQHVYDSTNRELSYARQLQSVLRREPDVVIVSEMDDKETARLSTKAAYEKKKIYAGMTASDSFDALDTFLGWVKDRKVAARVLLAITCQRLLRKLCQTCREAYRPDSALLRKANLPVDQIEHFYRPPSQKHFDRKGREIVCPTCQGTGYVGRVGAFELLVIDEKIRSMIAAGANTTQIKAQARKKKMYYIQEEGLLKTMEGITSMNEVLRSLREPGR
jgi:type II secretory ATPase GspE/PulE/Tfp pilus assembly ATPase PilB-like protein